MCELSYELLNDSSEPFGHSLVLAMALFEDLEEE